MSGDRGPTGPRLVLCLEYDGSAFSGWQRQPGRRTVQECLELALSRVADHPVTVTCAGRTDAGVHASGQVVHFDSSAHRPPQAWILGANSHLPDEIAVLSATTVPGDFHARFSAVRRAYRYRILNRPARVALARRACWWVRRPLDDRAMSAAARLLLGEHDFSSLRAAACQALHPVRTVYRVDVARRGEEIVVTVEANAFLHHMVRNLVGCLVAVGEGRRPPEWLGELLALRDRRAGAITAPPHGLTLARVDYPSRYGPVGPSIRL